MDQQNAITAVIGGSGLARLVTLDRCKSQVFQTPYGEPSSPLVSGTIEDQPVVFLARHGSDHTIAPHLVNYRANIWALKHLGVKNIIAVGAVGAIRPEFVDGSLVIPDQLIDYTHSRLHTFYDGESEGLRHVDFTHPYSPRLRTSILGCALENGLQVFDGATYAVTQGPRLETAAEIQRFRNDGADLVGMTSMPEAALARELEINYALIAQVVNPAAGLATQVLLEKDILATLEAHKHRVIELIGCALPAVNQLK